MIFEIKQAVNQLINQLINQSINQSINHVQAKTLPVNVYIFQ